MGKVRTRFAPSPTGRMHVGNLRTALYAYLIAKHEGGDFILRIEDTDQERYVEGAVDIIYRTLKKTGLIHDEGPDKDGGCGPYVQSERQAEGIYLKYAKMLVEKGEAYYCFCDKERLDSLKQEVAGKEIVIYDKHCLSLSKEEVPVYVHCPLITNEEHKKLSKRSGHSSYEDLLEQGFISEAIVNYVALLGWCPQDNREIFSLEELVEAFDYHHMSKTPSVFDIGKLRWMNGEYMKAMDFDRFFEMALPYIKEVITKDYDLKKIAALVKTRIETFKDIAEHIDFFEQVPEYDISMYAHKKMKTTPESALAVLKEILPVFETLEDYSNDSLYGAMVDFVKAHGYKNGYVMWPVRTAVSGKQSTPGGATEIMEILGKEESLKRIRAAIEKLAAANEF